MKRTYSRLAAGFLSVLGPILLTLSANGISRAAPLSQSDLPEGMAGVTWQLESMQTAPPQTVRPMENGVIITLQFDGQGNLSGAGACNSYFATYTVGADNSITLGPIGSSRKACAEDLMNLDQQYFGALQSANKYSILQGHLGFSTNNGTGTLNYISATPPTTPGMPATGSSTQQLLVLLGLALGACLVVGGMVSNRRKREDPT